MDYDQRLELQCVSATDFQSKVAFTWRVCTKIKDSKSVLQPDTTEKHFKASKNKKILIHCVKQMFLNL